MKTGWVVLVVLLVVLAVFLASNRTARVVFGWQVSALPSGDLSYSPGYVTTVPAPGAGMSAWAPTFQLYYPESLGLPQFKSWAPAVKAAVKKHPDDWRLVMGAGASFATRSDRQRAVRLAGKGWPYAYAGAGAMPFYTPASWPEGNLYPAERSGGDSARLKQARGYLAKAIALEPGNSFYDQLVAYTWLAGGNEAEAVASLERASSKPYWDDHFLDRAQCAEHSYLVAGADPLTARMLSWPTGADAYALRMLRLLFEKISYLGARAARAGNHERAIHLYRLVISSAWQVRTGASSLDTFEDGASMEAMPALSHFQQAKPAIDPAAWRFVRDRERQLYLGQQEFYGYLSSHGHDDLAQFLLAERARLRDANDRIRSWPPGGYDYSHGVSALAAWMIRQRVVMFALLVVGVLMLAFWVPSLVLPGRLRRRVTEAVDAEGRYAHVGHIVLVALPPAVVLVVVSAGLGLLPIHWKWPGNLAAAGNGVAVGGLVLYGICCAQAAWGIYIRRDEPRGFLTRLVRAVRLDLLWVAVALLLGCLVLAVPLNFAAGDAGWHLGRIIRDGELRDIPVNVPAFDLPTPPPPPEVASLPGR